MKTKNYSSILADECHAPITDVAQFKRRGDEFTMSFFFKGKLIGNATLEKQGKGIVHTGSVRLEKPFRKKGHGIHLYIHAIETARQIGAKRIYSSTALNQFSRRMWKEKLLKLYDVKTVLARPKKCETCNCTKHPHEKYYYIELN